MSTESQTRSSQLHLHMSSMDNSDLVATFDGSIDRQSEDSSETDRSADNAGYEQNSSVVQEDNSNCLQTIRKSLYDRRISKESADIIIRSWRSSTQKQYSSYIRRWFSFCTKHKINSVQAPLTSVLDFLTSLYNENLGYSALNSARSALSAVGLVIDGFPVGSHPLVIRYMKGIYNHRPSLPRYSCTWDVSKVLNYLRTLSPVKTLSLKLLSYKLAMLIALTLACRTQAIHLLDIQHMVKSKEGYTLLYSELLKVSKPGKDNPVAFLKAYPPDRRLCVIFALKEYLNRTLSLRQGVTKLFISHVKPHKAVSKSTISRWLREVMIFSGIDCEIFKVHSIRGAASSKASGTVPIENILSVAGWSNVDTFARFYNKPIQKDVSFADAVLQGSSH